MGNKEHELLEAARNGNYHQVEKLLSIRTRKVGPLASLRRGPGPNVQDTSGYSALHYAALNGHQEVVKLLLNHEASANIVDAKGCTPLHLAAWTGKAEVVDVLLSHGPSVPDVNSMNLNNETALHCAAQYGHTAVVTLLLEFSGDPTIKNLKDETPLDLAAQYGRLETVDLLIRSHPELLLPYSKENSKNRAFGITPLHAASRNGHKNVVNLLIKNGFDVNAITPVGTALHEATLCGKVEVAKILVNEGIDVNLVDCQKRTVMDVADELNTAVTREIRNLIREKTSLVEIDVSWNRTRVAPPENGTPYDNLFLKQPQSAKPWDSVIQDYKRHQRHRSYEFGQLSKSLDGVDSDSSSSSAKEVLRTKNVSAGARSRVAAGRVRSRTLEVELITPRPLLAPGSSHTLSSSRKSTGGSDSGGRLSSGDSGDKSYVTPDGYLTISGKARAPMKPPRRVVPSGGTTMPRHSRTLSFDTGANPSSFTPEPIRPLPKEMTVVKKRAIAGSCENVLDDSFPNKSENRKSGSADNLLDPENQKVKKKVKKRKKLAGETKVLLDASKVLAGLKNSEGLPLSPTHYRQPPTPDHPPPSAVQALSSISARIGPHPNLTKRQSRDIETFTDEILVIEKFDPVVEIIEPHVEEFVGDGVFSGLFKGSVRLKSPRNTPSAIPMNEERSVKETTNAERPRTLSKAQSVTSSCADVSKPASGNDSSAKAAGSFSHERSQSLQMLSPFDEKEEWNKISELIASMSSGLLDKEDALIPSTVDKEICSRQASLMASNPDLKSWLVKIGHPELLGPFVSRGFDDIQFLGSGILEDSDLLQMDIRDGHERRRILDEIARLPCKLPRSTDQSIIDRFDSVKDWLTYLNLDFYTNKFFLYKFADMEKVKKMWEVELTTILEITLPGHKKRILTSIGPSSRDGRSSLSSSTSSLAGRSGIEDSSGDSNRLTNEINAYQCDLREKLGYLSASPIASKTSTLNRTRARKKSRAPPPPPKPSGMKQEGIISSASSTSLPVPEIRTSGSGEVTEGAPALEEVPSHWLHPASKLIYGTCDYPAQYVGSTVIHHLDGTHSSRLSIKKLKISTEGKKRSRITLCISDRGVKFIDHRSKRLLCEHDVKNINSACQDDEDLRYFAYTTFDEPSGEHFCHVFFSEKAGIATEIMLTLGQAFEVAYRIIKDASFLTTATCNGKSPAKVLSSSASAEMSRSVIASNELEPSGWPTERSKSANDVQCPPSSGEGDVENGSPSVPRNCGVQKRKSSSASSSSEGSPPTVCKLEKAPKKKTTNAKEAGKKNDEVERECEKEEPNDSKSQLQQQHSTEEKKPTVKPRIPEKPKNVPPKPAHIQARTSMPLPQQSPKVLRKASSTPRVDIVDCSSGNAAALKRAPLATTEDF